MSKTRLSVYLDPELMMALAHYADRRGQSRSLIAEAAIAAFLSPDDDERREAAVTKRLDQPDRRMLRLERDVGISVEMMALFVRSWLSSAPSLPEQERTEARAKGGERYDAFVAALGRRLARGPVLRQEIPEDASGSAGSAMRPGLDGGS